MPCDTEVKPRLLWLQGITCNGNTHSFLNLPNLDQLLEKFEILYHPILEGTMDFETISKCSSRCDILIFEGSYDPLFKRNNILMSEIFHHYAKEAKEIIALGSCASFGGIFKQSAPERNSGLAFNEDKEEGPLSSSTAKLINLSGCPAHPEWLAYTLEMILHDRQINKDTLLRPNELYSNLAHHGCTRNEYFEWKVDAKDFGLKEGCLFYAQGCRGPMTHASCNKILWNEVSSKTRVGTPCFGCTEPNFPRKNLFSTQTNMSIPKEVPLGISKRSYLTMTGIAKSFHIERLEGKLIDDKKN
jgi:uptake hydrogenase small subunit